MGFFKNLVQARQPAGLWPKSKLLAALRRRYGAIDDLGEEGGFSLYGVTDGEIRFGVILAYAEGAPEKISEIGFLARFHGFELSAATIDRVNRNLHVSVVSIHSDGDLYLIGGVAASGDFSEGTFLLILEAWKRDLLITIQAISGTTHLADAMPASRLAALNRFALNKVPGEGELDLFSAFAGGPRALSLCVDCNGRGKTGFIARTCPPCGGSGFVRAAGRRG